MVVDGDRKGLLRDVLPDDILVEGSPDFRRFRDPNSRRLPPGVFVQFLVEDAFADIDATVANVDPGTGDELAHLGVAFAAEGAHCEVRSACHRCASLLSSFYSSTLRGNAASATASISVGSVASGTVEQLHFLA